MGRVGGLRTELPVGRISRFLTRIELTKLRFCKEKAAFCTGRRVQR